LTKIEKKVEEVSLMIQATQDIVEAKGLKEGAHVFPVDSVKIFGKVEFDEHT
jgi:hypothetical protein